MLSKEKEIQTINSKSVPRGPINSHSSFNYKIQKEAKIIYEITKEEYNQLFLQVCYKGDFIGRRHEFGYNNKCFHCELDISPIKDIDFKEQITSKKLQEEQQINYNSILESLLREQNIEVTDVTFKQLLNAVHQVNSVVSKPIYLIRLHKVTKETLYLENRVL